MIVALLLVLVALAYGADEDKAQERLAKLRDLRSKHGPVITGKSELFENIIKPSPRLFSVVLLLNAVDSRHQCAPCQEAGRDFVVLAELYYKAHPDTDLFFVAAEFDQNQEIFQKLKVTSAPVLFHVHEKGVPKKCSSRPTDGVAMAGCLRSENGIHLKFYKQADPKATLVVILFAALVMISLYLARETIAPVLFNPVILAQLSIGFCCIMLGGLTWVQRRGPPCIAADKSGRPSFIAGGSQSQYGAEAYIIAALTGLTAVSIILLAELGSRSRNVMLTYGLLAMLAVVFSLLLKIFRDKSQGYPFRFLF